MTPEQKSKFILKSPSFFLLMVLSLLLFPWGVAAGLEVHTTTIIVGDGVIDKEVGVNTHIAQAGLKYSEYLYTDSLGIRGFSEVNYTSDLSLFAASVQNSTLNIDTAFELTRIKQMACMRNYNLLSRQSFFTNGNTSAVTVFVTDNSSATFDLAQELRGAGGYKLLVRNCTDMHVREYSDVAQYNGDYELIIGNIIGTKYFPGAPVDEDWLSCP
jgi:hypothetical protein